MSQFAVIVQSADRHREAYEGGRKVGQIAFYVMLGVIVLWGIGKILRRK